MCSRSAIRVPETRAQRHTCIFFVVHMDESQQGRCTPASPLNEKNKSMAKAATTGLTTGRHLFPRGQSASRGGHTARPHPPLIDRARQDMQSPGTAVQKKTPPNKTEHTTPSSTGADPLCVCCSQFKEDTATKIRGSPEAHTTFCNKRWKIPSSPVRMHW